MLIFTIRDGRMNDDNLLLPAPFEIYIDHHFENMPDTYVTLETLCI